MGHQGAGRRVEVGPPGRRRVHVCLDGRRRGIGRVHLAVQRPEFGEGDVAGAAHRLGLLVGGRVGRRERRRAFRRKLGPGEDVGRGVKIALRMAADELAVLGEGHVAFDDAGAHARRRDVGFARMLGELQRGAAMADREVGPVERPCLALLEGVLQRPFVHVVDQEERTRPEMGERLVALGDRGGGDRDGEERTGEQRGSLACLRHRRSVLV